jgi:hypothetical protein
MKNNGIEMKYDMPINKGDKMKEITNSGTNYIKLAQTPPETVIVKEGKFTDIKESKFGQTYIFTEKSGEDVGVSASGLLKVLVAKNKITLGDTYKIVYKGKKDLKSGKTAHDFQIFQINNNQGLFSSSDSDELPEGLQ